MEELEIEDKSGYKRRRKLIKEASNRWKTHSCLRCSVDLDQEIFPKIFSYFAGCIVSGLTLDQLYELSHEVRKCAFEERTNMNVNVIPIFTLHGIRAGTKST
jgi:hypothetical protein